MTVSHHLSLVGIELQGHQRVRDRHWRTSERGAYSFPTLGHYHRGAVGIFARTPRMDGWMEATRGKGGHARPAGERRKDTVSHDAGSAASWRDPKATQPKRHLRASSTTAGRPATCLHSNVKHHTSRYRSILHVQYSRTI